MTSFNHPVQLRVERPQRIPRVHVIIRLALLLALGTLTWSSIYWLLYLVLPALVALLVTQRGGARYLAEDGPRIVRVLRWLAGAYAYLWLVADVLPTTETSGPVEFHVTVTGTPSVKSSLMRLLYSLPAVLLVVVLSCAGGLLWLVGAACILVNERLPDGIANFLVLTLRVQFRLLAYHLSLIDRYPSLEESGAAPVIGSQTLHAEAGLS